MYIRGFAAAVISRLLLLAMAVVTRAASTMTPALSTIPTHGFSSLQHVPNSTTPLETSVSLEETSFITRLSPVLSGSRTTVPLFTHNITTVARSEAEISSTVRLDSMGGPTPSSEITSPMVPSLAIEATTSMLGDNRSSDVGMQTTVMSGVEDISSVSTRTVIRFSTPAVRPDESSSMTSAIVAASTHTPIQVISTTPRPTYTLSSTAVAPRSSNMQIPTTSDDSDGGGLSIAVIAGIAAGGAALIILGLVVAVLVVLCLVFRARKRKAFETTKPKKKKRKLVDKSDSFVLHRMNRQVFVADGGR